MKSDKLHEECSIFGISLKEKTTAPHLVYNGLVSLQHRGQEGAGIASVVEGKMSAYRGMGLVGQVFTNEVLANLDPATTAIGHTRYSTTGGNSSCNVQPVLTEYLTGRIATAHNGNLVNALEIKKFLQQHGLQFNSTTDTEVASSLIAFYAIKEKDILKGAIKAANELVGAFSMLVETHDRSIIAMRDASGFRPICLGRNEDGIAVASESCALDSCGFEFIRDLLPGEVVVIKDGEIVSESIEITNKVEGGGICIFEYIYFARPDSTIDNLSVFKSRYRMGQRLAREYPVEADCVCGVPDSGLVAAMGYAEASGLPYVSAFVKNRYIGRSFIFPTQLEREMAVKMKLNPLKATIEGKRIVLIDDSIVRGTTSERIVKMLKSAGAKEIHMRISSPPFAHTCHYGTDIGDEKNLIINQKGMNVEKIAEKIGVDSLGYISLDGLKTSCEGCSLDFCTKCFTGNGDLKTQAKDELERTGL